MTNGELIRELREWGQGFKSTKKFTRYTEHLLNKAADALEAAEDAACEDCARSCACVFSTDQRGGPVDPIGECAYHALLRKQVPSEAAVGAVRVLVHGRHFLGDCDCRYPFKMRECQEKARRIILREWPAVAEGRDA